MKVDVLRSAIGLRVPVPVHINASTSALGKWPTNGRAVAAE